jgi:hypothetical protein
MAANIGSTSLPGVNYANPLDQGNRAVTGAATAPGATLNSTRPLLTPLSSKQAQQIANVAVEIVAIFMRPRNKDCGVPTFEKRRICSVHR